MKFPTLHLIVEGGKSLCGKRKGLGYDSKKEFIKESKGFALGLCGKCMQILNQQKNEKIPKGQ